MPHFKSCARCGAIHPFGFKCFRGKVYKGGPERQLRNNIDWTRKSREIRRDARYLCEVCRDMGVYDYGKLEVHHIEKVSDAPDKLLDNFNLVALCPYHHRLADRQGIRKKYLISLAAKRENNK